MSVVTDRRKSFNLVDLVILIISAIILVSIVFLKLGVANIHLGSSHERGRESGMRSNLQIIRSALEQFQADVGSYPTSSLGDLTLLPSAGTMKYKGYKGPYLKPKDGGGIGGSGIPYNPTTADRSDILKDNWTYIGNPTGDIHPANQAGLSTIDDNVAYSSL